MASGGNLDPVTQCPLCEHPVHNSDELQVHYLTSCSGYDVSHEEPRSKLGNSSRAGNVAMDMRGSGVGLGSGGVKGGGGGGDGDVMIGRRNSDGESGHSSAGGAAAATPHYDCSVQFMWQPLTHISYPSVTLLASFQRGSVEMSMDPEGGHYASEFVNIPKGSYEGQLVVGDSFIHPVKEFKVHKDDDIIVLQFVIERDYGYTMKTNPSYNPSVIDVRHHQTSISYANPMYGSHEDMKSTFDHHTNEPYQASGREGGVGREYNVSGLSTHREYLTNDDPGFGGSSHNSTQPRTTGAGEAVAAGVSDDGGNGGSERGRHSATTHETRTNHESIAHDYNHPKPQINTSPSSYLSLYPESGSRRDQEQGNEDGAETRALKVQLEEMTRERDTMRSNQERVNATWESKVKRLEAQLQNSDSVSRSPEVVGRDARLPLADTSSTRKEMDELRDHNAALEVQIREYEQSIEEQHRLMRTISSGHETRQLLDFTKKQQLEHVESFSEMKKKIENAMKLHDEYIKVSQTNIELAGDLEDYRAQTKLLLQEIKQKDREISRLGESLADKSHDRMALELETWKNKCDGWRGEVDRLEQEVDQLKGEREELSQQITLMVEEGENGGKGGSERGVMNYDAMMERMSRLQDVRVQMEEELSQLREERASLLRETVALREGSQLQLYTELKENYDAVTDDLEKAMSELTRTRAMIEEYRESNYELQQKLIQAINPDALKSIQERMDRYKKERDTARGDLEEMEAKLALAEVEKQSAIDALSNLSNKENELLQQQLESAEREVVRVKTETRHKYETRLKGYRDERNIARESVKLLKLQLQSLISSEQPIATTPTLPDEVPAETHSPGHEHYVSPVLEYAPDNYLTREQLQHYHRDTDSPSMEDHTNTTAAASTTTSSGRRYYHHTSRNSEASSGQGKDPCIYNVVQVKTKDEIVTMEIQRPMTLPNVKTKPQIIVKRGDDYYETGILMYIGKSNGKDIAGVMLDNKLEKISNSTDGTHKDGKRYFKCPIGYGLYVPLSRIYIEMETATV